MRAMGRLGAVGIGVALALAMTASALAAPTGAKTLRRTIDPIVLAGDSVPSLASVELCRLGLFASGSGGLAPIPFQIDQRRKGEYLLQSGPRASREFGKGGLDREDEIAFMAADAEGRMSPFAWPAGAENGVEIELTDPIDGGRAYVYLLAFADRAPRSPVDYVAYCADRDEIESTDYIIGYWPEAPISISKLIVKPAAGGSGQSVADRQKIRVEAEPIWNLGRLTWNESDFHATTIAWTDGPVRVLRQTKMWLTLFWRIPSPSVRLVSAYWKTGMMFPLRLKVPFTVEHFFKQARMRFYVDTPPDVPGRVFYNKHNPQGAPIDGVTTDAERNLDLRPSDWQVVAGTRPEHREGWFSRQLFDARQAQVEWSTYFVDDAATPDPPEKYPGCYGCLGFDLRGMEKLPAGDFSIMVQMFPMPSYRPGDERAYLNVTDRPVAMGVRALVR
jgi:hypothetical protein